MNRRYSSFFSNLSLPLFIFAMLASSRELGFAASALALVGWLHGLLAAARSRRWGWLAAMLGAGLVFLLAALHTDARTIQIGVVQLVFRFTPEAPLFLWILPGFLLAPTILYALVSRGDALQHAAMSLDQPGGAAANARRAVAAGGTSQQALNGGLILLGLFLVVASMRFGGGGMVVQLPL